MGLKNGFYQVTTTKPTTREYVDNSGPLTASNVGYLNNMMASGNSTWNNAADLTSHVSSDQSNAYNNSFYKLNNTTNGGGGTGDKTGGNKTTTGGIDYSKLAGLLNGNSYQPDTSYLESLYASAMDKIRSGYDEAAGWARQAYETASGAANDSYNTGVTGAKEDAAKSLREAYVNYMKGQKNLGQKMSALGLSGGATESTLANQLNEYGNNRNNINTTLNSNIRALAQALSENMANIGNQYQNNMASLSSQRAQAEAQAQMALASGQASLLNNAYQYQAENTQNILNAMLKGLTTAELTPTELLTTYQLMNANQTGVNNITTSTNYEEYMKQLLALLGGQA